MKTVLVTGGRGLVGSALYDFYRNNFELKEKYYMVFINSSHTDLRDYESALGIFLVFKPQIVIHLAANVGGLFKNMKKKVAMLEDNLKINMNVIRCSYETGVKQCISCLSTCIFPDAVEYPITEDQLHNGPPHPSNDAYAYAKRFIDIQNRAYNEQYGLNYFCIIPCNIYGRYDNFSLRDGHVLPALIHRCYLAKKEGKPFLVKGTGKPLRQFIHNADLARYIMKILDSYDGTDNIIISSNPEDEVSIRDVALEIARNFDYEDNIEFDDSFADGQYKKTVSNKRLTGIFGKLKFTNIKMGIQDTVQWFVKNYDKARK
jgi:GDP-L-fucose synthase